MQTKYLIVGNSAGGIAAAEAIREIDEEGSLTIVCEEPYPAYSRPLLSKYLTSEQGLEGILFRPRDFYERNNILFLPGRKAVGIELERQSVYLDNGECINWERLLLAVGGKPTLPQVKGGDKKGVFTFTSLDDAKGVAEFLSKARKAVIIGGGLIGINVSEALVNEGVDVAVVVRRRILSAIADEEASRIVEGAMREAGVQVIIGHTVAEITGGEQVEGVTLDNGERISCQLLVVAAGISPRLELASSAKLNVNKGIVVDQYMGCNHPNVYACGDAVEAYDFAYGDYRINPTWPNAYIGGRIAGYNMTGHAVKYLGSTMVSSVKCFGLAMIAAGVTVPPQGNGYEILTHREGKIYQKLVLKAGVVKGMILVGAIEKAGILFGIMKDKVNVENFKHCLLDQSFGLASLPQGLREEYMSQANKALIRKQDDN
jgi:NAD(P)H-nitrite reductase large subunit